MVYIFGMLCNMLLATIHPLHACISDRNHMHIAHPVPQNPHEMLCDGLINSSNLIFCNLVAFTVLLLVLITTGWKECTEVDTIFFCNLLHINSFILMNFSLLLLSSYLPFVRPKREDLQLFCPLEMVAQTARHKWRLWLLFFFYSLLCFMMWALVFPLCRSLPLQIDSIMPFL